MRLPSLKQVVVSSAITAVELNRLIVQFSTYLKEVLDPLLENPRARSTVQTGIVLTGGTARVINHMLQLPSGKTPQGWAVTDINAAATVRRTDWTDKTITLIASATATISLEVW